MTTSQPNTIHFSLVLKKNQNQKITKKQLKVQFWCKAMNEKLKALEQNETWKIISLPKNKKLIGCKWVYKTKYNSDGIIEI